MEVSRFLLFVSLILGHNKILIDWDFQETVCFVPWILSGGASTANVSDPLASPRETFPRSQSIRVKYLNIASLIITYCSNPSIVSHFRNITHLVRGLPSALWLIATVCLFYWVL